MRPDSRRAMRGLLPLWLLPVAVIAGQPSCPTLADRSTSPPARADLLELDEVIVAPRRATRRPAELGAWLQRLQGQFRYEGQVAVCSDGKLDQLPVTGTTDCRSLYARGSEQLLSMYCVASAASLPVAHESPAVVLLALRLAPAVSVLGVVPDLPGMQLMEIDNQGMASHSRGTLSGDTLTMTGPCGLPGSCRRVTRVTATSGSGQVSMRIDFESGTYRVREEFLLHRVSDLQSRDVRRTIVTRDDLLLTGE